MINLEEMMNLVTKLPMVTDATGISLQRKIIADRKYIETALEKLKEDNPLVAQFIRDFSVGRAYTKSVESAGTVVYKLLELQGQVPQVLEDTTELVTREILGEPGNDYLIHLVNHVYKKNPGIVNFIAGFGAKSPAAVEIIYSGMLVYRLLEKQTEINKEMLNWL